MPRVPLAAAFAAAVAGAAALAGWAAGDMSWVRFDPAWVPLQPGAAFALVAAGAGLAAAALGFPRTAAAAGTASILSGALPPVEPVSVVCAALAGAALLSFGVWRRWSGALLAGFGAAAAFCLWRGLDAAFGWEGLLRLSAPGAAGWAAFGLGIVSLPRKDEAAAGLREATVPATVGLAAAAAALCLWLALEAERVRRIEWTVASAVEELQERLETASAAGRLEPAIRDGTLFGGLIPSQAPRTYGFALYYGRMPAYSSGPMPDDAAPFVKDVVLATKGSWRVRAWPSADLLGAHASALPKAVLAVGLLLSALLAAAVHLALVARRQAAELEDRRRELQTAGEAKSRFLANVSRELRNPLNAILGYSELLLRGQDGPLNAEQREDLEAVRAGGRTLARLTEQLIDLARLEAGVAGLAKDDVSVDLLLDEASREFSAEAAKKGLALKLEADGSATVTGDRARLRQAVRSVVENAVKFTRTGGVTLGLERARTGEVVISVRDTGPGLSDEEKLNLFEPFWQSRGLGGVKRAEGLGLGLHLAKRIVELHGGRVSAVGEAGAGSAFFLSLPPAKEASR